jgi:hypothetical protein
MREYITISKSFVVSRAACGKSPESAAVNLPNFVQLTRISVSHAQGKRIKTGSSPEKASSS